MAKKSALGRGLGALLSEDIDVEDDSSQAKSETLNIDDIYPREDQPRKHFDQDLLNDLAISISEHGIIQPLLVSKTDKGYEIIAGERRYRAAKIAGIDKIPVIVKDLTDKEIKEVSIIENIQREDLNPIEEALAYRSLIDDYGLTQAKLGERLGKSRSYIANTLRLLKLEEEIQEYLIKGELSSSQARTLLSIDDRDERFKTLNNFLNKETNIRQVENRNKSKTKSPGKDYKKNIYALDIENRLTESLEAKVSLREKNKGGQIIIDYYDNDDLDRLIGILEEDR